MRPQHTNTKGQLIHSAINQLFKLTFTFVFWVADDWFNIWICYIEKGNIGYRDIIFPLAFAMLPVWQLFEFGKRREYSCQIPTMQIILKPGPSRNESALLSSALLFSHTFSKMYYLLTLCIVPDDFACYIVKLTLELMPRREKISICLRLMLCPCPKDIENGKTVGRTQDGFAKYGYGVWKIFK